MREDSEADSWALSDPVRSDPDIRRKFGHISYSKGASVIRQVRRCEKAPTILCAGGGRTRAGRPADWPLSLPV